MKRLVIEELIWPEVAENLENIKVAIVPVGSCEQHGPNSTFVTDTTKAYELCKLLADQMGNKIIVYPPVGYGLSLHHMDFPGSVTLRVETMLNLLYDIAKSIASHGFDKILFVNGHGGNRAALEGVVIKAKMELGLKVYWTNMGTSIAKKYIDGVPSNTGHACEIECSQTMVLNPDAVRDVRYKGEVHETGLYAEKKFITGGGAWSWKNDATNNGALGDARKANKELGQKIVDHALEYLENLIEDIAKA